MKTPVTASLHGESLLSLSALAKLVPRDPGEKPPSSVSMWRWAVKGIKTASGRRVKLETLKVGGRMVSSRQALVRFFEACST